MSQTKLFIALAALAVMTSTAHASLVDIVNIDFNGGENGNGPTATGAAVVGALGDFWNGENGPGPTGSDPNLKDTTGANTGITLAWNDGFGAHPGGWNQGGSSNTQNTALMQDYIFNADNQTNHITLSNLPSGHFDIILYNQSPGGGRPTSFTIGADTKAASDTPGNFLQNGNFVVFSGLFPVGGVIDIGYFSPIGGEADVNGLQIERFIPEPASLGLLAVGGLALLRRRR